MHRGRLSILMLVVRMGVFLVRIIRNRRHDGRVGWGDWIRGPALVDPEFMYMSVGVGKLLLEWD